MYIIYNDTLDLGFSLVFLAILTCNVKSKLFKHVRPKAYCLLSVHKTVLVILLLNEYSTLNIKKNADKSIYAILYRHYYIFL